MNNKLYKKFVMLLEKRLTAEADRIWKSINWDKASEIERVKVV